MEGSENCCDEVCFVNEILAATFIYYILEIIFVRLYVIGQL